jgi:hypothetical protein
MPADHRLRFHDEKNIGPARPCVPQSGPEEAVEAIEWRPRAFALEHGDLLAQRENLKRSIEAALEEGTEGAE